MKDFFNQLFKRVSARDLAIRELENAKRHYLEHKTHQEYFAAQVTFELQRIARLEKYLEEVQEK